MNCLSHQLAGLKSCVLNWLSIVVNSCSHDAVVGLGRVDWHEFRLAENVVATAHDVFVFDRVSKGGLAKRLEWLSDCV